MYQCMHYKDTCSSSSCIYVNIHFLTELCVLHLERKLICTYMYQ